AAGSGAFGLSPLRDQELAGSIMWVAVTLIYVLPAMTVTVQLLSTFTTEPGGDERMKAEF
ncbi:MAG: cytochrome c oxidase assembly protein, partial [Deltaproteobacteria bacterium]